MKKNTSTKIKTLVVADHFNDSRLDVFLVEKLKISRSQVQKMIDAGQILVNGKTPKKSGDRVRPDDNVVVSDEQPISTTDESLTNKSEKKFTIADIEIVAETPDYFVVNKPSGMLTHSTNKNEADSLAAILLKKYPKLKSIGDTSSSTPGGLRRASDPMRPGIVHRLDKEASGLLVVAKTQTMFDLLKEQFKQRQIEKEYTVLAHDQVAKDWDEINFPIDRGGNDRMVAIPKTVRGIQHDNGKQALTEFFVETRYVNFTLLKVIIHTGRMHQIRVHLLAYNHPVVGDPLYNQAKRHSKWDAKLGRLFLHCTKLAFTDLQGHKQTFESELPKELTEFLKLLK